MEVPKTHLDTVPDSLLQLDWLEQELGLDILKRSLPPPAVLCFCVVRTFFPLSTESPRSVVLQGTHCAFPALSFMSPDCCFTSSELIGMKE